MKKIVFAFLAFILLINSHPSSAMKRNRAEDEVNVVPSPSLFALATLASVLYQTLIDTRSAENDEPAVLNLNLDQVVSFSAIDVLPSEVWAIVFGFLGPVERNAIRLVSSVFRNWIDFLRHSRGWTDTLPVVATIQVGAQPGSVVAHGRFLCVSNRRSHTVSVIDPSRDFAIRTIAVAGFPRRPVALGSFLYVASWRDGVVSQLDLSQDPGNEIVNTIEVDVEHYLGEARGIDRLIYVEGSNNVAYVIDPSESHKVIPIAMGQCRSRPVKHGQFLYVTSWETGLMYVLDPSRDYEVVDSFSVGGSQGPTQPLANGHLAYVPNDNDDTVSVIDLDQRLITNSFSVGQNPITPILHGSFLYVASDNAVDVINLLNEDEQIILEVGEIPQRPLACDNLIYIASSRANGSSGFVFAVDPKQGHKIVHIIGVGPNPQRPMLIGRYLFVLNYCGIKIPSTISVINTQNHRVIRTIQIGREPHKPVLNGRFLYVSNRGDNTVAVIDLGGYLPDSDSK